MKIERAKSGRSTCKICGRRIAHKALRIGFKTQLDDVGEYFIPITTYRHAECYLASIKCPEEYERVHKKLKQRGFKSVNLVNTNEAKEINSDQKGSSPEPAKKKSASMTTNHTPVVVSSLNEAQEVVEKSEGNKEEVEVKKEKCKLEDTSREGKRAADAENAVAISTTIIFQENTLKAGDTSTNKSRVVKNEKELKERSKILVKEE